VIAITSPAMARTGRSVPSKSFAADGGGFCGRRGAGHQLGSSHRLVIPAPLGPATRAGLFVLDRVPVVADRREHFDQHRAVGTDHHRMRNIGEDPPHSAGPDVARLAADLEVEPSLEQDADLFVLVRVLGHDGVRVELDQAERDPLAMDAAADDSFPDLLRPERANLGKRIHAGSIPILSRSDKRGSEADYDAAMRRCLGALAAALLAAGLATGASAGTSLTITLTSEPGEIVRHAHPPSGDPGDVLFSTLLLSSNVSPRAQVGSMRYSFRILSDAHATVNTVTTLADGTIRASATNVSIAQATIVVAITGGTGRYAGAVGTLTFGPMSTQTNVYKLALP
jgi:hypothetical protein